ncbi:MAG: phosphoribosyltransferase family protein [Phormidesmis sp.]
MTTQSHNSSPQRLLDRTAAGKALAAKLKAYANQPDTLVLALPRGGLPVAYEVAQTLNLSLDICLVRKLGLPGYPEVAMGAIASAGVRILNRALIDRLTVPEALIDQVAAVELRELERRDRVYRGDRYPLPVRGRTIILVDDGLATGSTMRAAISLLEAQQAGPIIIAVPVLPPAVCQDLEQSGYRVVRLATPSPFYAISLWYENFAQVTDREVTRLLGKPDMKLTA